jgi:hypothetical protein
VNGTGNFTVQSGLLEFGKAVGSGQNVTVDAGGGETRVLQLDDHTQFDGSVIMMGGDINLLNLANADSYTYKNDLLSIYSGGKVIDTLRLSVESDALTSGISIEKVPVSQLFSGSPASLIVYANSENAPYQFSGYTTLPLHT